MRLYTFCNYYLSSIQQGIQSAHLVHDLFVKYNKGEYWERETLFDWATDHKTMVVLNGGNSADLDQLFASLATIGLKLKLPFAYFKEDEVSLNNALTCVGIVVPEIVYAFNDEAKKIPMPGHGDRELEVRALAKAMGLTKEHVELAELIKQYPLAK